MKKVLIGIAAVLVIIVVAIIAIPFFVPLDAIRDRIITEVKTATGRDLVIAGPVDLSVFPAAAVELSDVSLSNAPGAARPSMITLGQLDVEVALLPLLSGEIAIQRLILREPVIALEVDESGRGNWVFEAPGGDLDDSGRSAADAPDAGAESSDGLGLSDLRLGEVGIVDGSISYVDRGTGQSFEASNLTLDIELESLDSPLGLTGELDFQDRRVNFKLGADRPRALVGGGNSSVTAALSADAIELNFRGAVTADEVPGLTGELSLSIPSVADIADWLAIALSEGGLPVDTVFLQSQISANPTRIGLQTATLTIDDLAASGDLEVTLNAVRPLVFGRLAVDQLNLDPFLGPADGDGGTGEAGGTDGASDAGPQGWSDEPIDFSPLMLVDTDLVVASEGVTLRGVEAGPSVLTIKLKDGVLDFDLARTALFGGHVALQLGANGAARTPTLEIGIQIDEVQAEPVLANLADFDRLTGATNAQIALASAGNSQRALVEALDGTAALTFRDGSIKGINLAAMVRNVTTAFSDPTAEESRATDFAELSATFQITDGIARSQDMRLLAPLLRVEGTGQISLPPRSQSIRLVPKLVADAKGQGGALETAGLSVPVIVGGTFDNPTFRPDLEGLITDTLQDPGAVRDQVEGLVDQLQEGTVGAKPEDAVRNLLEGLSGGGAPQSESSSGEPPQGGASGEQTPAPNPGDALRNLFTR